MAVVLASQSQITKYITRSIPQRAMTLSYTKLRKIINKRYRDYINVGIMLTTKFTRMIKIAILLITLIKYTKK
jgi:hypothetical protein